MSEVACSLALVLFEDDKFTAFAVANVYPTCGPTRPGSPRSPSGPGSPCGEGKVHSGIHASWTHNRNNRNPLHRVVWFGSRLRLGPARHCQPSICTVMTEARWEWPECVACCTEKNIFYKPTGYRLVVATDWVVFTGTAVTLSAAVMLW